MTPIQAPAAPFPRPEAFNAFPPPANAETAPESAESAASLPANAETAPESAASLPASLPANATSLLLDTNVWLSYFLPRRASHKEAKDLLLCAARNNCTICVAETSMKDVFFLLSKSLKEAILNERGSISEADALAAQATAWACLDAIRNIAVVLPVGPAQDFLSRKYRSCSNDYEDCLVFATAELAKVSYLVTEDKQMLAGSKPVATVNTKAALDLVQSNT